MKTTSFLLVHLMAGIWRTGWKVIQQDLMQLSVMTAFLILKVNSVQLRNYGSLHGNLKALHGRTENYMKNGLLIGIFRMPRPLCSLFREPGISEFRKNRHSSSSLLCRCSVLKVNYFIFRMNFIL